jgi:hypothetical protein
MNKLKSFLEERNGVKSLMRLQSLLTLFFSFGIIVYQVVKGNIFLELDILLITACFAPKLFQKFAEVRMLNKEKKEENE